MPAPATSASASGHALVLTNLFAGYQDVPVVRELNLEVQPGEVVALLGPNGAGKTTTLETIAGLNRPISGTVELSGENIGGTPAYVLARRGLALVPEDAGRVGQDERPGAHVPARDGNCPSPHAGRRGRKLPSASSAVNSTSSRRCRARPSSSSTFSPCGRN